MTIDIAPDHIFVTVLPAVHRQVVITACLVLNMMKPIEFFFELIFAFLGLAVATPLAIAGYLIVLLIDTDAYLSYALSLMLSKLLIVTVAILCPHHFLLLSPTASFVELLQLLMIVAADGNRLMRDLWKLEQT